MDPAPLAAVLMPFGVVAKEQGAFEEAERYCGEDARLQPSRIAILLQRRRGQVCEMRPASTGLAARKLRQPWSVWRM